MQLDWTFTSEELESLILKLAEAGFAPVSIEAEKTYSGRINDSMIAYNGFCLPIWSLLENLQIRLKLLGQKGLFYDTSLLVVNQATSEQRLKILLEEIITWFKVEESFKTLAKEILS